MTRSLTKAQAQKARYWARKTAAVPTCTDCGGKTAENSLHCAVCLERRRETRERYRENGGRKVATRWHRKRRQELRDRGVCFRCEGKLAPGRSMCQTCLDKQAENNRRYRERVAAGVVVDPRKYTPLDEAMEQTRTRVLRAARWLDWFTGAELNEAIGALEEADRNRCTAMLARLTRHGLFERRGEHVPYDYRIVAAGIAELARALR